MRNEKIESAIEEIVGESVSGVAFVHDYFELHFDGKIVRALTMPTVTLDNVRHTFPEPGSRDALCSLIGKTVEKIAVRDKESINIVFAGGGSIRIPLTIEGRIGPEAAHYVPGSDRPISVW